LSSAATSSYKYAVSCWHKGLLCCALCSRWFYKGALQDGVTAAEKPPAAGLVWPNQESPVMVAALRGMEERAEKSGEKVSESRQWHFLKLVEEQGDNQCSE